VQVEEVERDIDPHSSAVPDFESESDSDSDSDFAPVLDPGFVLVLGLAHELERVVAS
jgi:hypothetical protein